MRVRVHEGWRDDGATNVERLEYVQSVWREREMLVMCGEFT
jgi:hypothetical protein